MRQRNLGVNILVLTNLITIVFLAIVSLHYHVPLKILKRLGIIKNNEQIISTYYDRSSLFTEYYPQQYRIVMLGDSITAGTAWNELLGITDIANRGIGGDTTEGFYNRLSNIYSLEPELCFIMGGINDIFRGTSVEIIDSNMEKIINALLENKINPIIQSTLYVSDKNPNWKKINDAVDSLNSGLKKICSEKGLIFLDINNVLSVNGTLKNEYTYDSIHLTGSGYKEWSKIIFSIIATHACFSGN